MASRARGSRYEIRSYQIYFDDMQEPVMTADDKTFLSGRVGIGSFDDTGNFDEILLFGKKSNRHSQLAA